MTEIRKLAAILAATPPCGRQPRRRTAFRPAVSADARRHVAKPKSRVVSCENRTNAARPTRRRTRLKNWLASSVNLPPMIAALNRLRAARAEGVKDVLRGRSLRCHEEL